MGLFNHIHVSSLGERDSFYRGRELRHDRRELGTVEGEIDPTPCLKPTPSKNGSYQIGETHPGSESKVDRKAKDMLGLHLSEEAQHILTDLSHGLRTPAT